MMNFMKWPLRRRKGKTSSRKAKAIGTIDPPQGVSVTLPAAPAAPAAPESLPNESAVKEEMSAPSAVPSLSSSVPPPTPPPTPPPASAPSPPPTPVSVLMLENPKWTAERVIGALEAMDGDVGNSRVMLQGEDEDEDGKEKKEEEEQQEDGAMSAATSTPAPASTSPLPPPSSPSSSLPTLGSTITVPSPDSPLNFSPPSPGEVHSVASPAIFSHLSASTPFILDIYAPWCGPCKQLTPILEDVTRKSFGFNLLKINSDDNQPFTKALGVSGLPTLFAVNGGKVVAKQTGMFKSGEELKAFVEKMVAGKAEDVDWASTETMQLAASTAALSFGAKEATQQALSTHLSSIESGDTREVLRALLGNVVSSPFEEKFRTVDLSKERIRATIGGSKGAKAVLKIAGFKKVEVEVEVLGEGLKKNKVLRMDGYCDIARVALVRDAVDANEKQAAGLERDKVRKAKGEEETKRAKEEAAEDEARRQEEKEKEEGERGEERERLREVCVVKFRRIGGKKVETLEVAKEGTMEEFVEGATEGDTEGVEVTCVNKKRIIEREDWGMTMEELDLLPGCSLVLNREVEEEEGGGAGKKAGGGGGARRKIKKGSHTMASVGIYSTRDNMKGELIDGGGGTVYEQVTESEDEVEEEEEEEEEEKEGTSEEEEEEEEEE